VQGCRIASTNAPVIPVRQRRKTISLVFKRPGMSPTVGAPAMAARLVCTSRSTSPEMALCGKKTALALSLSQWVC